MSVRQKLVLGAGAIGIFSILVFNGAFRTIILGNLELRRLNAEMSALENEQAALSSQIASLRSNDAALERAVRRELGFLRPGEIEYRFPPPSPDDRNR